MLVLLEFVQLNLPVSKKKTALDKNSFFFQGKGKKRAVGWFPASYVKLLAGNETPASGSADTSASAATNGAGKSL